MINSVIIATFSFRKNGERTALNGMIEPLLYYFKTRAKKIEIIDGSHPGSDTVLSYFETYKKGALKQRSTSIASLALLPLLKFQNSNATQLSFKVRDFFAAVEFLLTRKKCNVFIGLESVYTIAGIFLKKLGKAEVVIYYVSDYTPNRYGSKLINNLYLALDRFCCQHADVIWDVSPAMLPARISAGLDANKVTVHKLVPNALFPQQISYLSTKEKEPYSLVFAGTFGPENGPKLAIDAFAIAVKKITQLKLHMIGGGDKYEQFLRSYAKKLKLDDKIIFHGFINNAIEVSNITKKSMVGIAPYMNIPNSPRLYADATKIRLYLGAGLPVITTTVPPLAKDKEIKKSIIVVKDSKTEMASAILEIFKNKEMYTKMRLAAIKYAKQNTWENTYDKALEGIL